MRELDRRVFVWVHSWPDALAPVMSFMSEGIKTTGLRVALLALLVAMIVRGGRARAAALLALVAWPLANGLTEALKTGFPQDRPSVDFIEAIVRGGQLTSSGTASSHAANMAAVAYVFVDRLGWWGAPWVLVALLTGLSRVYMGVHYPSQVLLGWACGTFCGMLVVKTWDAYAERRSRGREGYEQADAIQPNEA